MRLRRRLLDVLLIGIVGPLAGVSIVLASQAVRPWPSPPASRAAARATAASFVQPIQPGPGPVAAAQPLDGLPGTAPATADFGAVHPSHAARHMADWVVARNDNGVAPFFVIDKRNARLYVFEANGTLVGTTTVLLGAALGDDSYPGIGQVAVQDVKPWQRTTPAGRFITRPGVDDEHHDVVWIDYDAAVAMHRVIDKVHAERRPERLASPDPRVKRISFGCVNVPIPFFDRVISPVFGKQPGVAYIIPEVRSFRAVFETHVDPAALLDGTQSAPSMPATLRPVTLR